MIAKKPANIDEYISRFPEKVQLQLQQVRKTIHHTTPEAQETIKYGMPTFFLNGNLVFFAAFKNHIGFYPFPAGIEAFEKELSAYKVGKGSIQFPIDKPMPLELISKIVKFRVLGNLKKVKAKTKKGK